MSLIAGIGRIVDLTTASGSQPALALVEGTSRKSVLVTNYSDDALLVCLANNFDESPDGFDESGGWDFRIETKQSVTIDSGRRIAIWLHSEDGSGALDCRVKELL